MNAANARRQGRLEGEAMMGQRQEDTSRPMPRPEYPELYFVGTRPGSSGDDGRADIGLGSSSMWCHGQHPRQLQDGFYQGPLDRDVLSSPRQIGSQPPTAGRERPSQQHFRAHPGSPWGIAQSRTGLVSNVMSENDQQLSPPGRGPKGAPWDNDVPDWRHPSVFLPPDRWRPLQPGDEADSQSDLCRPTLEVEEVAAASAVWTTEGAPLGSPIPGQPLFHPEKTAMGMGDIPNKDLAFEQQKCTLTLRCVTCDGRQHQEPTPLPHKRSTYVVTPDPGGTATVEVVLLPRMKESISMQSRGSLCTGYPDPGGNSSVEVADWGNP